MANEIQTIKKVNVGGIDYYIETDTLDGHESSYYQEKSNLVTTFEGNENANDKYPSAKCVYDMVGTIEAMLRQI